jgi:hypothetical protein
MVVTKKLFVVVILSALMLNACATQSPPKEVEIPIPVNCPAPQIPPKPHLPISNLAPNSSPDTIIKAYASSVELLMGYSNQLITILNGYKTK